MLLRVLRQQEWNLHSSFAHMDNFVEWTGSQNTEDMTDHNMVNTYVMISLFSPILLLTQ